MKALPSEVLRAFFLQPAQNALGASWPKDNKPWPIFTMELPDDQDNAICIYNTAGMADGRLMRGETIRHPGLQILVRSQDPRQGMDKAIDLTILMDQINRVTVQVDDYSYLLVAVSRTSDVIPLGPEEARKRRLRFSVNARCTVRPGVKDE